MSAAVSFLINPIMLGEIFTVLWHLLISTSYKIKVLVFFKNNESD